MTRPQKMAIIPICGDNEEAESLLAFLNVTYPDSNCRLLVAYDSNWPYVPTYGSICLEYDKKLIHIVSAFQAGWQGGHNRCTRMTDIQQRGVGQRQLS